MNWYDIAPEDAVSIALPREGIEGPVNEMGEPCPWPWEPQQLVEVPLGQYHCEYCGAMVVAGVPHPDYRDDDPPVGVEGPNVDHAWIDEADLFGTAP